MGCKTLRCGEGNAAQRSIYREWSRRPADVEALRALRAAIDELLVESPVG